jgi:multiple sugar transport system ATP-binding protein
LTQIELRGVQKYFGAVQVIKDLNLKIDDNEFIVLLGQSGCGKTTTLRAIAGLETIDGGDILIDGKPMQHLKAADRDIAMVFQSFSLYPHMSVYENIAFPLRATRKSSAEIDSEVRSVAKTLQITDLLDKKPSALSGGDMQRVAIGRALVRRPKAMLMDEPIGALDAKLREEMRARSNGCISSRLDDQRYVTHDQIEAMSLADRITICTRACCSSRLPDESIRIRPICSSPSLSAARCECRQCDSDQKASLASVTAAERSPASSSRALCCETQRSSRRPARSESGPEGVLVRREGRRVSPVETQIVGRSAHSTSSTSVGSETLRARTKSGFIGGPGERFAGSSGRRISSTRRAASRLM